ncbi:hypothetical protein QJQ45_021893 [Haematococcus lacustris]|nr:hypothetical protein QJQ45_021893 [Haematococcus lacustris]
MCDAGILKHCSSPPISTLVIARKQQKSLGEDVAMHEHPGRGLPRRGCRNWAPSAARRIGRTPIALDTSRLQLDTAHAIDCLAAAQDVPPECLSGATSLQSACSSELSKASATLGITAGGSDVSALGAAAKQAIASGKASQALAEFNPSAGCCKAACSFAATGCLCNQGVVDLVNAVTGVDANTAKQLTGAFATKCKFQDVSLAAGTCSGGKAPAGFKCPS